MASRIDTVVVLHGYGTTPSSLWFPWLHALVERHGAAVEMHALPDPFLPDAKAWLRVMAPSARTWDKRTMVIGHSIGGALALRLIEQEVTRDIGPVILVAAPFAAVINVPQYTGFFDKPIDWGILRSSAYSYTVLHAKDDPLVPPDHALRYAEALEADHKIFLKGGHFTKKTFPFLGAIVSAALTNEL